VLPRADIDLRGGVVFQDQPTLTWIADPVTRRIRGRGDGWEAIRQAVEIIVSVERFKWQIYTPNFGTDYNGLLGTEPGYAASELQRRLEDAFLPDSRILGMKDFTWSFSGVSLSVRFTVLTVFGDVASGLEVPLR
jgi:hypothetical protein